MTGQNQAKEAITTDKATHSIAECVIRPELIPNCVREDIGRVGLEAYLRFYEDPAREHGFREWLPGYLARGEKKKGGVTT